MFFKRERGAEGNKKLRREKSKGEKKECKKEKKRKDYFFFLAVCFFYISLKQSQEYISYLFYRTRQNRSLSTWLRCVPQKVLHA